MINLYLLYSGHFINSSMDLYLVPSSLFNFLRILLADSCIPWNHYSIIISWDYNIMNCEVAICSYICWKIILWHTHSRIVYTLWIYCSSEGNCLIQYFSSTLSMEADMSVRASFNESVPLTDTTMVFFGSSMQIEKGTSYSCNFNNTIHTITVRVKIIATSNQN